MKPPLRVLIIEDSEDDALLLQMQLEKGGYELVVNRVETAAALTTALTEHDWDIIISDYKLPGFDGLAALNLVQEHGRGVPFILVSGAVGEELAVAAMKAGADDFLVKDRLSRLVPAVERALRDVQLRRQRRLAEESLQQSEDRYRGLVQASAMAVWTAEAGGDIAEDSPSWRTFTGQTLEQFLGCGWLQAIHPDDRTQAHANWQTAVERKSPYHTEYRIWHAASGTYRYTLARGVPLLNGDESIREWVGMNIDITELRQAMAAQRESEERLRLTLEASELGWWRWDYVNNVLTVDDKVKEFLRLPVDASVTFEDVVQLTHEEDRARLMERASELRNHPSDNEVEMRVVWPDGSIHWLLAKGRSSDGLGGNPSHAMGIVMDITQRKQWEEELKAARNSAECAKAVAEQANRAKDHFLAVLSHELRTPLTPVMMGLSMLQDRSDLAAETWETLEMVRRNVELEARLIDDLLDVSRIARGKVELNRSVVPLCTVIGRAVEICKPDIEARQLHFGVDFGPATPYWVEVDVSRLQQVFWNLLKNAIKFTPHGGCVGIRCQPKGDHVVAEVNDSGMGIEPESLLRIFNAFEQVEQSITRQFGGLGLGLAISKALVEMHGGKVEAHSEGRDKGATFRVTLPLCSPVGQSELPVFTAAPQCAVRPLHILLVEDHGITAKMMQMVLSAAGHTVERAGDIAAALKLAEGSTFDLLVSDLGLPDGSGHDLMRQLRHRGYSFPGIALSGYGQEEDIKQSHQVGFAAHLIKPASREAVVETIASIMSGNGPSAAENLPTTPSSETLVFDVERALKHCAGEPGLLAQMIQYFFDDYETLLPQIHAAFERGDFQEMGRLAHRIKGTLLGLGAELAEEAAAGVERIGLYGGEPVEAEKAVRWLERECQVLKAALTEYRTTGMATQA